MFGISTNEKMSESFLTSYKAWDRYVSQIWYKLLLFCDVDKKGSVVEIAPGASSKIAHALKELDFRGEIYLVEPHDNARKLITEQYQQLLPKAMIYPINKYLFDCIENLPQSIQCVISHHPLDDMLMSKGNDKLLNEQLFSWVNQDKASIPPLFEAHWQKLVNHPQHLNEFKQHIIEEWWMFIEQLKPKNVLMSQYPSLTLETDTLKSLNQHAEDLLQMLKIRLKNGLTQDGIVQTLLNQNKNYNVHSIGNEVLNAKNWFMYRNCSPVIRSRQRIS